MNNKDHQTKSPRHRGPGPGVAEKPKDFGKAIKEMIKNLHNFIPLIVIALILAALGSVLSIIGPNKLSDLTDKISEGLVINQENLKNITETISSNFEEEKLKTTLEEVLNLNINNDTIKEITTSKDISNEDKLKFQDTMSKLQNNDDKTALSNELLSLPDSIKKIILKESTYQDKTITYEDKVSLLELTTKLNDEESDKTKILNSLSNNVKEIILPTFTYKKTKITTNEQVKFLTTMSEIDKNNSATKTYSTLDKLPKSIKGLIEPKMDLNGIKKIAIFLLTIYLISALFNFIESFLMATVSNNFAKELRSKISVKINKLPLKYFDSHSYGDILSRVTNDVDTIGVSMYQSLGSLVSAITLFIGSIIMMFVTNWIMALTAIISSFIGFIFMFVILGKSQKYFTARQVELGKLNGHIEEIYSSHNVVKAYNGEKEASKKFDKLNYSVYNCNRKSQFLSGLMQPIMAFIGNFSYVAVCLVGAILTVNGHITFGVIVAFMIYIRLFTSPLTQIAQGMTNLQTTAAASERVFEFLGEEEMSSEENIKGSLELSKVKGNIEFNHVKFGYNNDKLIIKDFNCKVKPGQKVAIVGPTGAGKTTMVNLLMKFYDINSGEIKIDKTPISNLTRDNIHKLFIMVLQDTWLFNGTIRDNIKYNKENVTDEEIWNALETVGVDHFVKSLPQGLDYEITDNESISAGQKQLLTIARGMIENAPFLILDEATSSVDTRTEELVQKAMDKLTEGRTSFIIAHRLSTIKNADIILVMNEGNIIEQGNHNELMKKKGFYADLYNSQFQK